MKCARCGSIVERMPPRGRSLRVLEFIIEHHARLGRYPNSREIMVGMRYGSLQAVSYHLNQLKAMGALDMDRGKGGLRIMAARRFAA
ncbi:MAG: hypothetical protein AB7I13_00115 [Vicinamibacterales bacterium]